MSLQAAFEELVDLAPDERARRLRELALGASEKTLLESMLQHFDTHSNPLDTPASELLSRLQEEDAFDQLVGRTVGSFLIIEPIGKGGSSEVFRASRPAGSGEQFVALKVLRAGRFSAEGQRRFLREQAILAQLTHPNVARLIEAGHDASGLPYIAMELVEGEPITTAANSRALGLDARLTLFAQLCRALDAAHAALVVHCDLKPCNVLVDGNGALKVLDFGVARLIDASRDDVTTTTVALTPEYAAPEQYRPGRPTVAVDIFALGVMLGELVCGQRLGVERTERASDALLAPGAPEPPRGLAPRLALVRQLRGDIDAIIATATALDPARRYRSADALACDIEHYLAGRPVSVRAAARWYRTRKFVRRHRVGVAAATGVLLALLLGFGAAWWEAIQARREAQRANAVRDFIEQVFEPVRDGVAANRQPTLAELVAVGVDRLDGDTRFGPAERVDLTLMFARLYNNLGERPKARDLADRAVALAEMAVPKYDTLSIEALSLQGSLAVHAGDYAVGEPAVREAHRRLIAGGVGGEPLLRVLNTLEFIETERGHSDVVIALARRALDERIRLYGPDGKETATGYNELGYGLEGAGFLAEAAENYRRVYEIDRLHRDPESFEALSSLAMWARMVAQQGEWRRGRDLLAQANSGFDKLGTKPRKNQVLIAQQLCSLDITLGDAERARESCSRAMRVTGDLEGASPATRGDALRLDAGRLVDNGEFSEARLRLAEAEHLYADTPENAWRRGSLERLRAEMAWFEGNAVAARDAALRARPAMEPVRARDPTVILALDGLILLACRRAPDAACPAELTHRLRADLDARAVDRHPRTLIPYMALARVALEDGDPGAAGRLLGPSIAAIRPEAGDSHPLVLAAQLWLAAAHEAGGDCEAADRERAVVAAAANASLWKRPIVNEARNSTADSSCVRAGRPSPPGIKSPNASQAR